MICSLFFFGGCRSGEDDTVYMKIIYKPYSTSKVLGTNKTYAELVEENVLDLSEDILTQLVGAYGPNAITIIDGILPTTLKPSLNGVDYKQLFGYGTLSGALAGDEDFALELGSMTNLYFSTENKLAILTQGEFTSSNLADLLLLIPQLMVPGAALDNVQIVSGSLSDLNALLRVSTGDLYYYVFYGGKINGQDYISSANNFQNAKNYFARILNTNYNVIEKDFVSVNIVDESNNDLQFAHWKYNLLNGNLENAISNGNTYLNQFLEKYKLPFAVHVAKAMLVGNDNLPDDIPTNSTSLASLYEQATVSNAEKCGEFLKVASNYIDHIGLTNKNVADLLPVIKSNVIGDGTLPTDKIYENSEKDILTKNNYETIISACLNRVVEDNPAKPILEYITINSGVIDELVIEGYLHSIIFMSEQLREMSSLVAQFEYEQDIIPNYQLTLRYNSKGEILEYPIDIEEEDFKGGIVSFDFGNVVNDIDSVLIENSKNVLAGDGSVLVGDLYKYFIHSSQSNHTDGHAWCFNDLNNSYVELIFATNSKLDFYKVDIFAFSA